ncbi:MAG: VWA domain-containing protein [Bryobacterales bacterium]|nr:VWA domain-containing protein [Acidobacteriota bacterium]MCB9385352.1 VWA domain-containing protein [Bryobacterales bacterium]
MNANKTSAWAALAALALTCALPTRAQGEDPLFKADARLVVLHVTVVDKDERLVTDLTRDEFRIFEDDKPQVIKDFRQEDVPVSVGILVDNSGSMRDKRLKVNSAAVEFVKASNPNDEVFIVNFNDEAYLDTNGFTNDIPVMQDALQRIDSRGGTALYDAIQMSLDFLNKKAKNDKRVLLVISDGEDNASRAELENVVRELQEQEKTTTIYAVGLLSEEEKRSAKRAERALKYIARATGGPSYFPETVDEVTELTKRIAADIRNQYTVTYTPTENSQPGFRTVKVELEGKAKRNEVRHRPGYYAQ